MRSGSARADLSIQTRARAPHVREISFFHFRFEIMQWNLKSFVIHTFFCWCSEATFVLELVFYWKFEATPTASAHYAVAHRLLLQFTRAEKSVIYPVQPCFGDIQ